MLLRLLKAFDMALLTIPVIVVYYQAHGLSMRDVMLLQAIFGITMIVLEIPSGYFSDVLGRRKTLIIGGFMHLIGWIAYAFASSFTGFLVAEMLLGVGAAFISGTDSAMLYDTLLELGESSTAVYQEGRLFASANFAEAIAAVIGGLLAMISLHMPFYCQIVMLLPVIPLAFMLTEPTEHRRIGKKAGIREIVDVIAHVIYRTPELRYMMLTSSFLTATTLTLLWMYQPFWTLIGVPVGLFGLIWAGGNGLVGVVSMHAAPFATKYGEVKVIGLLIIGVATAGIVLGLASTIWLMPLFAMFYISRGLSNPIFTKRINERVDSSVRATVLSIRQLGMRLTFVLAAPTVGSIGDEHGLSAAIVATSIAFGIAAALSYVAWQRSNRVIAV